MRRERATRGRQPRRDRDDADGAWLRHGRRVEGRSGKQARRAAWRQRVRRAARLRPSLGLQHDSRCGEAHAGDDVRIEEQALRGQEKDQRTLPGTDPSPSSQNDNAQPRDVFNRPIRDLRISVTDRCNFRCTYCMPFDEYPWIPRAEILTFEEITRLARVFVALGVRQIRLTGGEPLVRTNLDRLIGQLSALDDLEDLSLT